MTYNHLLQWSLSTKVHLKLVDYRAIPVLLLNCVTFSSRQKLHNAEEEILYEQCRTIIECCVG